MAITALTSAQSSVFFWRSIHHVKTDANAMFRARERIDATSLSMACFPSSFSIFFVMSCSFYLALLFASCRMSGSFLQRKTIHLLSRRVGPLFLTNVLTSFCGSRFAQRRGDCRDRWCYCCDDGCQVTFALACDHWSFEQLASHR